MKTIILLVFVVVASFCSFAQEFSFELYFEDAIGNRDTIVLGFDENATDSIDTAFGEVNIISQPWDSVFEVRITDEYEHRQSSHSGQGTFHTKKQIVKKNCHSVWSVSAIDINVTHFPVIVSWDSTLFNSSCLNGTVFTGAEPEGWWDVSGITAILKNQDSITLIDTLIPSPPYTEPLYYYYVNNMDTIYTTWFTFADSTIHTSSIHSLDASLIKVSPNPFVDQIQIDGNFKGEVKIFNNLGQSVQFEQNKNILNLSNCPKGFYYVMLIEDKSTKNNVKIYKMIKNQ